MVILAAWPLCFLAGLTLIGGLGGGFQSRFLLPILPVTCILACLDIVPTTQESKSSRHDSMPIICCLILLLVYMAAHTMYYGILFGPLYADLDHSLWDILACIISSPYNSLSSRDQYMETFKYLKHFGLNRTIG